MGGTWNIGCPKWNIGETGLEDWEHLHMSLSGTCWFWDFAALETSWNKATLGTHEGFLEWDSLGHHERRMSWCLAFILSLSSGGDLKRGRSHL